MIWQIVCKQNPIDSGQYHTSYHCHSLEQEIKNSIYFLYDGGVTTVQIMLWECSRRTRPLRGAVSQGGIQTMLGFSEVTVKLGMELFTAPPTHTPKKKNRGRGKRRERRKFLQGINRDGFGLNKTKRKAVTF